MSKIVISGYYGFANAGDEAMLTAIVGALRQQEPQVELTVLSGNPSFTEAKHKVKALPRFNLGQLIGALLEADLLLSGGGSLLQVVTSSKSLLYYLGVLALGELLGKKVVLYAQGIGPIRATWARRLTGFICQRADLITVRDDGSLEELKNMGIEEKRIVVTADAVFSLPPTDAQEGKQILAKYGKGEKPLIGLALRPWQGQEKFIPIFAKAAVSIAERYDADLVFLPFQFAVDRAVADKVLDLLGRWKERAVVLDRSFSPGEYLSIISNLDLVIGMRLHALVFAALNKVPFLAVSYDPKVDRFVNSVGGRVTGDIASITAQELEEAAVRLWQREDAFLAGEIAKLRQEAARNIQRVLALIDK